MLLTSFASENIIHKPSYKQCCIVTVSVFHIIIYQTVTLSPQMCSVLCDITERMDCWTVKMKITNERADGQPWHQLPISATTTMYDRSQFSPNEPATIMCLAGHICLTEQSGMLS